MRSVMNPRSLSSPVGPDVRRGTAASSPNAPATVACSEAKDRLLAGKGDPLVIVDWQRTLFFNFAIDPNIVRGQIPPCFELELHEGRACISLVALTKRNFRRHPNGPAHGEAFRLLREQKFLNFRIYLRHHGESGVLFKWGWLSRPWNLPLPDQPLGLTCAFADINYSHVPQGGPISGIVRRRDGRFVYSGTADDDNYVPCTPGSLAEFAMERYSGFFWHRGAGRVFRAWHKPWLSVGMQTHIEDLSLVTNRFPWFAEACLVEARLCADCPDVWLGRAHRLAQSHSPVHHRASAVFEMP
jgi:uncharacterized protein